MSADHLFTLAAMFAEAHGKAERFQALADARPLSRRAEYEAGAARWRAAVAGLRTQLRTALRAALPASTGVPAAGTPAPSSDPGGSDDQASVTDPTSAAPRRVACPGLADSCRTDPHHTGLLDRLNLRVYPPETAGAHTEYVVLDVHHVSIGVQRREHDLYLHVDTTETTDRVIAVEINGGGETDHPTT